MLWSQVRVFIISLFCLGIFACQALTQELGSSPYRQHTPSRDGIGKVYMGREIAQVMGHEGAYWLERPSREVQEHPQILIDLLALEPNAVIADIGAGTGYMAVRMAQKVPDGEVFAVEIQSEMLTLLRDRLLAEGITHVQPIQGTPMDPNLPPDSVDLALMVDAYHEFEFPYEMMTALNTALKPGGQVVLAEYRAENPMVLIKRLHKMSEKQVKREMKAVGLSWLKTDESLPQQHLLFFQKPQPRDPIEMSS